MIQVSELTEQIKTLLESTFLQVSVYGEVSRPTYHSSGHLYFTLKDDKSAISCVMFKGNNQKLKFRIEEGMEAVVHGGLSVYSPRGTYQINCFNLEPNGSGALALAYEQLKKKLNKEGYFDQKRALPKFPKHIALVTSSTGAALQDMIKVANKRYPLVKLSICNTLVQGEEAKLEIVQALQKAQELNPDLIVLARGGGSIEDLWAFNEEIVAKAIFQSKIPTISAIGHAIDTLISDFVADATAPTPSAAMQLALPDINELRQMLDANELALKNLLNFKIQNASEQLIHLNQQMLLLNPKNKIKMLQDEIKNLQEILNSLMKQKIELSSQQLNSLKQILKSKNPNILAKNGFVQVLKQNKITPLEKLKPNDEITLVSIKKTLSAKIMTS